MFHCKRRGRAAKREERGRKISPPLHNFTFSLATRGFTHRKLWLSVVDKAYRRVEQAREARARKMDTYLPLPCPLRSNLISRNVAHCPHRVTNFVSEKVTGRFYAWLGFLLISFQILEQHWKNLTRCDQAAFLPFCLTIIVPGTSDHDCPLVELDIILVSKPPSGPIRSHGKSPFTGNLRMT